MAALVISAAGAVNAGPAIVADLRGSVASVSAAASSNAALAAEVNPERAEALLAEREDTVTRDSRREARTNRKARRQARAVGVQADARTRALADLADRAEARARYLAENRWVLPLSGYRITATFGESGMWSSGHTGTDMAAPYGTPLLAITNAVVTEVAYDGAYGLKTTLTLDDGAELTYAHQSSATVSVGEQVAAGDVIGYVGMTGRTTGPHLHLEWRPDGETLADAYSAMVGFGLSP